jgi:hypothetical protein
VAAQAVAALPIGPPAIRLSEVGRFLSQGASDMALQASEHQATEAPAATCRPACPVCGGRLIEIRGKLQCGQCHTICETCCEGGRG